MLKTISLYSIFLLAHFSSSFAQSPKEHFILEPTMFMQTKKVHYSVRYAVGLTYTYVPIVQIVQCVMV